MTLSIAELRSAFQKQDTQESRPNNYYPFWNMKVGEQTIIRFLPDANPENPLGFMVEKLMHTLVVNGENKTIPCLKMYGEDDCPICKVSSAYYKADDKVQGKKYWRKKQHLLQALIVDDPLPADAESGENHEGQVRVIALGFQLYNIIKEAFESGELDEIPYAYENGCNFIIKKTKQGDYDTYAVGSKFARKSSSLDEDEIAALEDSLLDLSTLLPSHPTYEKVESMLEADITGGSYDDASSKQSSENEQKPSTHQPSKKQKVDNDGTNDTKTKPQKPPKEEPKSESNDEPAEEFSNEASDILAKIRNRRKDG